MFTFDTDRLKRRPSLTPMIDVVFLLLVFFMLAARFGQDVSLPLSTSGAGADYTGPPRVVSLSGDDLALNGLSLPAEAVIAQLPDLMTSATDVIFVQPTPQTSLQQLVTLLDMLRGAGFSTLTVLGAP